MSTPQLARTPDPDGDAASRLAPSLPWRIAHFDLDTFFVSVERSLDPS
ncbi:MAG: DNA polymerase IV, partial [Chloroflexi bacterium]|nr:DNA polymerase IV [Chloroflexota bacterium]